MSNSIENSAARGSKKVEEFWSNQAPPTAADGGYLYSPITRPYILETAFGAKIAKQYLGSDTWATDILIERYLAGHDVKRVLSLCCGFGHAERALMPRLPSGAQCLALDIAPGAVEAARRLAEESGVTNVQYEVADLNTYKWIPGEFDLILANGALHHLTNLEQVLSGVRDALKPGGVFFSVEFVGPNYQDHTIRQLELINLAAFMVPRDLRARTGSTLSNHPSLFRALSRLHTAAARPEQPKWPAWKKRAAKVMRAVTRRRELDFGVVHISPKAHLLKVDPSECIRSADVIPVIKSVFPEAEVRPMGGGLLEFCLDPLFYEKFSARNPRHVANYEFICAAEKHYMKTGEIGSDFAIIAATV
jgi:SAM-dependent methyltransferase